MTVSHPAGLDVRVEVFWNNVAWSDITADVRVMVLRTCQRSRLQNTFDPGSLTLQLDNRARKYDPLYSAGTFYGNLKPGRLVRVSFSIGFTTEVWWGHTDRFDIDYDKSNKDSIVTLTCIDNLARAALIEIPAGTTPAFQTGDHADARLVQLDVVVTGTGLDGANYTLTTTTFVAEYSAQEAWDATVNHNLLDEVRRVADVEQAPCVSSATSNQIIGHPRNWFVERPGSFTSQATIGTGGLPFQDVNVLFDADEIITAVSMTDEAGNAVVAIDTAGVSEYGTRYPSISYSNLPTRNDEQLEAAANTVIGLRATEEFRLDSLTVKPASNASWPAQVVDLELLDRVTVVYTPTLTGSAISADYFIDGIEHQVTPGDWTTVYSLMPASRFDAAISADIFRVDDSLVGGTDQVGF